MQRKPGGYRKPTQTQRELSRINKEDYNSWFQQFWNISGASTKEHPAPYPLELAYRLVRMFSFVGDIVVDPFVGTGTTMLAAMQAGRNSIGLEIEQKYARATANRLKAKLTEFFQKNTLEFCRIHKDGNDNAFLKEEQSLYII